MRIALDYDGTYTLDPEFWNAFIKRCFSGPHEIFIVTMRNESDKNERIDALTEMRHPLLVVYTNRKAKKPHIERLGVHVDIWIDDQPEFLLWDAGADGRKEAP